MEVFIKLLGQNGLIGFIGLMIFIASFKYSVQIFEWLEKQTYNTRTYLIEQLDRMFLDVKPDHVLYAILALSFGSFVVVTVVIGLTLNWITGAIFGIIAGIIGWKIPRPLIDHLIQKRMKEYSGQMVDGLQLLANGIRAGLSVPQSLSMVVNELPPPISQEFGLILQQNKVGVPLEECFENLSKRLPLEDNDMFVSSINILRETGGNLAETFDTIVSVIRERVRLQQKIDTYTAQGMFQGYTMACMPFAMGGIYFSSDPDSMMPLFTHPIGIVMLIIALGLDALGLYIILKIVQIKI